MLRPAKKDEFAQIYTLLQRSFPPDEYRPEDAQRALLGDARYTAYVTENVTAVVTVWKFSAFAFIEHFAVDPQCRNQGLGGRLLGELIAALNCPVCLEAELPDTDLAKRRLRFYQRNGFFVNGYPYTQPAYAEGKNPIPMGILTTGSGVDQEQFEAIRDTLYREVYRI